MLRYSVVVTTYNDEKNIEGLLSNIMFQSILPSEIVVVDGGSSDETCKIIKQFDMRGIKKKLMYDRGRLDISQGLNMAIQNCTYDYIGIVATGNTYDKFFFENLIMTIEMRNCDVSYGPVYALNKNENIFTKYFSKSFMQDGMNVGMPSNHGLLARKGVFEKVGFFYEKFVYAGEDTEFFIRAQKKNIRMTYTEKAIMYWSIPENFNQYIRQQKNYAIAEMQIRSFKELCKFYKEGVIIALAVLTLVVMLIIPWCHIGACVLLIFMAIILFLLILKHGLMTSLFLIMGCMVPFLCFLSNIKYIGRQYHVAR